MKNFIKKETYEKKLLKLKEAAQRKESRLKKRMELQKDKAKLPTEKALKKELKRITHLIVRYRYPKCYSCGNLFPFEKREAGHYYTDGGHANVRYDFDNLRTQCHSCNVFKGGDADYSYRLEEDLGNAKWKELRIKAHTPKRWKREELQQLIAEREPMLEEYKSKLSNL